jgi:uncharacterized cupin superfamily protein
VGTVEGMSGYTVSNLKEVEDSAVAFGLSPDLEARFARDALGCEQTGLSYQRLAPGARSTFSHRHAADEEIYVVLSGGGSVRLDDDDVGVGRWDAVRVAPGTARSFAAGPDGLELLAFGTHRPDDVEMLPAPWDSEADVS